jgi:nucleotide-binding universal stress UspA family protein
MNRILVAIDCSEVIDQVISKAVALTKALNGRLCIIYVDDSAPYSYTPTDSSGPGTKPHKVIESDSCGSLEHLRTRMANAQLEVEYRMLEGPAADNILTAAREFGADIIVIGAHAHGKFYHLLFGDTTESLIHRAPCPILVVPHKVISPP